jgi:hypothetical protein
LTSSSKFSGSSVLTLQTQQLIGITTAHPEGKMKEIFVKEKEASEITLEPHISTHHKLWIQHPTGRRKQKLTEIISARLSHLFC